jgi:hypothetical protein
MTHTSNIFQSNPFVEAELCQTVSGHFLEELLLAAEFFSAPAFRVLAKSNGFGMGQTLQPHVPQYGGFPSFLKWLVAL